MRYVDYENRIDHLIELADPHIYDGWSVAVLTDGTLVNRWENDEGTGPEPGYERRYAATKAWIELVGSVKPAQHDDWHVCPECVAGKCRNCDGTAWCLPDDTITECVCSHARATT